MQQPERPLTGNALWMTLLLTGAGGGWAIYDLYRSGELGSAQEVAVALISAVIVCGGIIGFVWLLLSRMNRRPADEKPEAKLRPDERPLPALQIHFYAFCFSVIGLMPFVRPNAPAPTWKTYAMLTFGLAAALGFELWYWFGGRQRQLTRYWRRQGRCHACGYDLQGVDASSCPECGATRKAAIAEEASSGTASVYVVFRRSWPFVRITSEPPPCSDEPADRARRNADH